MSQVTVFLGMCTGLRIQIQMNALEMLFALQQIYNPSVHQQFPNFPFKAKKELERKKKSKAFSAFEKNKKQQQQHNNHLPPPSFASAKHKSKHALDPICSRIRNCHSI